ncbi:hypothetical protein EDB19DRAFT_1838618 [Suillus lakei]|nr:hypothetical protein EDB19DRAFT_1838618 [Suillus lakei]
MYKCLPCTAYTLLGGSFGRDAKVEVILGVGRRESMNPGAKLACRQKCAAHDDQAGLNLELDNGPTDKKRVEMASDDKVIGTLFREREESNVTGSPEERISKYYEWRSRREIG